MANIRVLDLDLDFFLSSVSRRETPRAENQDLVPWSGTRVRHFLGRNCGLSQQRRLPGSVLTTHDELFYRWRAMYDHGVLKGPLDVVHVDAHADLGGGIDGSCVQLMGELLHRPVSERADPRTGGGLCGDGLNEANFLLFAIACRWIASLTYVYHIERHRDPTSSEVNVMYFRDNACASGALQLKAIAKEEIDGIKDPRNVTPLHVEPPVPYRAIHPDQFHWSVSFDYIFLTRSPEYTPCRADRLVPLISNYITRM